MRMRSMTALSLSLATVAGATMSVLVPGTAAAAPCGPGSTTSPMLAPGPNTRTLPAPQPPVEHAPLGRMPVTAPEVLDPQNDAAGPTPIAGHVAARATLVDWVTGSDGPNRSYQRFRISGTDLGIMWDNGQSGTKQQVLMAFGDTFGNCAEQDQEWRKNTLMRSSDKELRDGLEVHDAKVGDVYAGCPVTAARPKFAKQIIASLGLAPTEFTVIPTAGIAVDGHQVVNFMSVRAWGTPGRWTTNFSGIAVSADNGENWHVAPQTLRINRNSGIRGAPYIQGNDGFQMAAYVQRDGYVYTFGTPSGRQGAARLARVPAASILNLAAYEYWDGSGWTLGKPAEAEPVINGPASEMSVQWNDYLGKYLAMYTDGPGNVVLRTAEEPQGPWSAAETVVSSNAIPGGTYAPYVHPWSSGNELYFTLSLWSEYNVMLMRTTLTQSEPEPEPNPNPGWVGS
jgi:hypothetical protein